MNVSEALDSLNAAPRFSNNDTSLDPAFVATTMAE